MCWDRWGVHLIKWEYFICFAKKIKETRENLVQQKKYKKKSLELNIERIFFGYLINCIILMAMSNFSLCKSSEQGQGRQSGLKPLCAIFGLGTYTVLNKQMGFQAQNLPLLLCNWSSSADTELPFF